MRPRSFASSLIRRLGRTAVLAFACSGLAAVVACGTANPPATTAQRPVTEGQPPLPAAARVGGAEPQAAGAGTTARSSPDSDGAAIGSALADAAPGGAIPARAQQGSRPPSPPPLLGRVTEGDLRAYEPWAPVFETPYVPDASAIEVIKAHLDDVTIFSIIATWCPDTRRELPRLFAIMKAAGLPGAVQTMVGVDRTKKDAEGMADKWGITRVPTFVFLRGGREIGRVAERTPAGSTLEAEIARIVSGGAGK